jgi:hypothetical protein
MKTIWLVTHRYLDNSAFTPLVAYSNKESAERFVKAIEFIVMGTLEVTEIPVEESFLNDQEQR